MQTFDRITKLDTPEYSMNCGKSGFALELYLPHVHILSTSQDRGAGAKLYYLQ